MNRYEKDLREYRDLIDDSYDCLDDPITIEDSYNGFKELVERATPSKPTAFDEYSDIECPSCERELDNWWNPQNKTQGGDDFCPNCGQALDWSE